MSSPTKGNSAAVARERMLAGGPLTAEQAYAVLEQKLSNRYNSVRRCFLENKNGNTSDGYLDRREFRAALERIGIVLTGTEYRRLWRMFDSSGDGRLSYIEFNNKVGPIVSPMSLGLQMKRPQTPPMAAWKAASMAKTLRKKIQDIEAAFQEIDTDSSGRISHAEFIQALRKVGVRGVGDQESFMLMEKYKQPGNDTGEMTFSEFRDCMTAFLKLPSDVKDAAPRDEAAEAAERKLHDKLPQRAADIMTLFSRYDASGHGDIDYQSFRAGLESGGVQLSEDEFAAVCRKHDPLDDGQIMYREFALLLRSHAGAESTLQGVFRPWVLQGIRPVVDPTTGMPYDRAQLAKAASHRLGITEAETRLVQSLVGRKETARAAFDRFDLDKNGLLNPRELASALEHLDVDVTDDLISTIFAKYDTNKDGNISFDEFEARIGPLLSTTEANLRKLMLERDPHSGMGSSSGGAGAAAAATSGSARYGGAGGDEGKDGKEDDFSDSITVPTAAMDLSETANKMKRVLGRSWKTVLEDVRKQMKKAQAELPAPSPAAATGPLSPGPAGRAAGGAGATQREMAAATRGMVTGSVFRDVLAAHGVPLTSKEVRAISMRYHGAAPAVTRGADGYVDVEKALRDAMYPPSAQTPGKGFAPMSHAKTAALIATMSPTRRATTAPSPATGSKSRARTVSPTARRR